MFNDNAFQQDASMARLPDITELTGKQLRDLIEKANGLFTERKAAKVQEYRQKIAAELAEEGISIAEVFGITQKTRGRPKGDGIRTPAKVKYRNPANPEETWTGKGRTPKWMTPLLEDGKSKDDFLIDKA